MAKRKDGTTTIPREYASVYFSPRRGTMDVVVGFIEHTRETLDLAVYSVTHPRVLAALVDAHARGVEIRFLTDKSQAGGRYAIIRDLEAAGIRSRRDRHGGLMHHKYAVSDGRAVATGSFNWTRGAEERNAENLTILRLRHVILQFELEFESIWESNAPD